MQTEWSLAQEWISLYLQHSPNSQILGLSVQNVAVSYNGIYFILNTKISKTRKFEIFSCFLPRSYISPQTLGQKNNSQDLSHGKHNEWSQQLGYLHRSGVGHSLVGFLNSAKLWRLSFISWPVSLGSSIFKPVKMLKAIWATIQQAQQCSFRTELYNSYSLKSKFCLLKLCIFFCMAPMVFGFLGKYMENVWSVRQASMPLNLEGTDFRYGWHHSLH